MAKSALLIKTIELLKTRPGITLTELASLTNRSERTVYRWLAELVSDLQTPVYCHDGGYYISDHAQPRTIDFTAQELLVLRLSLKGAPFGASAPIRQHADSAWAKIRDAANLDRLGAARGLAASHSISVTTPEGDVRPDILEMLEMGINKRRRMRVLYRSQKSDEVKQYMVDPYAMVFRRHSWYLLAFSHEHGKVIQMKTVRFMGAVDAGVEFDVPAEFSVDGYFESSWEAWAGEEPVTVRVRFSPEVARMIAETKRHPTQVVCPQADGGVIFEAVVSGIQEIGFWIMSYGKNAEVLEPESLRRQVLDHVAGMSETYGMGANKTQDMLAELT